MIPLRVPWSFGPPRGDQGRIRNAAEIGTVWAIGGECLRLAFPHDTHLSQLAPPLRQPLVILAGTLVCASRSSSRPKFG